MFDKNPPMLIRFNTVRLCARRWTDCTVRSDSPKTARTGFMVKANTAMMPAPKYPDAFAILSMCLSPQLMQALSQIIRLPSMVIFTKKDLAFPEKFMYGRPGHPGVGLDKAGAARSRQKIISSFLGGCQWFFCTNFLVINHKKTVDTSPGPC